MNIRKKSKMFLGLSIGTRRMKKTRGEKSRVTVPISTASTGKWCCDHGGGWDSWKRDQHLYNDNRVDKLLYRWGGGGGDYSLYHQHWGTFLKQGGGVICNEYLNIFVGLNSYVDSLWNYYGMNYVLLEGYLSVMYQLLCYVQYHSSQNYVLVVK